MVFGGIVSFRGVIGFFFHLCVWEKENLEPGPLFFAFYYDDYEVAFIWGHIQIWRDFRKIFLRWYYCILNLNFLIGL